MILDRRNACRDRMKHMNVLGDRSREMSSLRTKRKVSVDRAHSGVGDCVLMRFTSALQS